MKVALTAPDVGKRQPGCRIRRVESRGTLQNCVRLRLLTRSTIMPNQRVAQGSPAFIQLSNSRLENCLALFGPFAIKIEDAEVDVGAHKIRMLISLFGGLLGESQGLLQILFDLVVAPLGHQHIGQVIVDHGIHIAFDRFVQMKFRLFEVLLLGIVGGDRDSVPGIVGLQFHRANQRGLSLIRPLQRTQSTRSNQMARRVVRSKFDDLVGTFENQVELLRCEGNRRVGDARFHVLGIQPDRLPEFPIARVQLFGIQVGIRQFPVGIHSVGVDLKHVAILDDRFLELPRLLVFIAPLHELFDLFRIALASRNKEQCEKG